MAFKNCFLTFAFLSLFGNLTGLNLNITSTTSATNANLSTQVSEVANGTTLSPHSDIWCNGNKECVLPHQFCDQGIHYCVCGNHYRMDGGGSCSFDLLACTDDSACPANSRCKSHTCLCRPGFVATSDSGSDWFCQQRNLPTGLILGAVSALLVVVVGIIAAVRFCDCGHHSRHDDFVRFVE